MPATSMPLNSPVAKISESRKPIRAKVTTKPKNTQPLQSEELRRNFEFYAKNKALFDSYPSK